jgi:hypothetical protein
MSAMSIAEFARHIKVSPGYVSQLKSAGRLVLTDGKVDAEASLQRIADTQDPSKIGVVARHEKARAEKLTEAPAGSAPPAPALDDMAGKAGSAYQQARAMKEKYNAQMARIAYEQAVGILLVAADARAAVMNGDVIIRSRLESLPDLLAPQLAAETDEQKIRALLMDQIEQLLSELSGSFRALAKP